MELFIKPFSELTNAELYEILKARAEVFVVEQNCVYNDLDGKDEKALHIWYAEKDALCAYLRVCEKAGEEGVAHVGRVLTLRRKEGLGAAILKEGIRAAFERMGAKEIYIEAQTYARGFYAREGFEEYGEEFLEDGIPHIRMRLKRS
ncbi:MAG: GNAT family N-acetyltransferase [Clostridia bacterium]|nr:GNAT family N-acetyltransferase [Clostridia bacterium]